MHPNFQIMPFGGINDVFIKYVHARLLKIKLIKWLRNICDCRLRSISNGRLLSNRECYFCRLILVKIDNNSCSMHREYHEFYAVHVYLRSICISLVGSLWSAYFKPASCKLYCLRTLAFFWVYRWFEYQFILNECCN